MIALTERLGPQDYESVNARDDPLPEPKTVFPGRIHPTTNLRA